ncbi:MAG: MerR family transcriptional regulator, repressor of the yfmOP operon [Actinomycetota bacterium]|nr:MerR family transcriptional regulator, repressor of the yfmOP operon [Actinomycetota bacterium]
MTDDVRLLRIGEVAERLGISTRTLRYYEELRLLDPSGRSPGGGRRYDADDVERVRHIRDLQQVLGFNLDEIGEIVHAEDRLAQLRTEYRKGVSVKRQEAILHEAFALNERLQQHVSTKIGLLNGFMAELRAKAHRYTEVATERGLRLPSGGARRTPRIS